MKLVLCEGLDEVAVIGGLCAASGIAGLTIEPFNGRNQLRDVLKELTKRPEFVRREIESLGILLDADTDPSAAWQKLRHDVQAALGLDLPERGAFLGERPSVAGFLIHGPDGRGMLEDLCLEAVGDQPGFPCVEDYFRCLAERTGKPAYHAKARFRAWMASQSDFDLRVGKAAEKGLMPWANPAFDRLREFLNRLMVGAQSG
jgi:hypothetical protein